MMGRGPFFVAAGIPAEIYWMEGAVDAIPDVLKTVVDVAGFIVSAALLGRWVKSRGHTAVGPGLGKRAALEV